MLRWGMELGQRNVHDTDSSGCKCLATPNLPAQAIAELECF